jgi:hypothetical protein
LVLILLLLGLGLWFWTHWGARTEVPKTVETDLTQSVSHQVTGAEKATAGVISSEDAAKALVQQESVREGKVWDALFLTPIGFYGKVVDEKGTPIPGANVSLSFDDTLAETKSKQSAFTDDAGLFSASGHGLAIVVQVSKNGYYRLKKSDGVFGYSQAAGRVDAHPDSSNPAIFVLRKMGSSVPLIHLKRFFRISENGDPVEVSLYTGKTVSNGLSDLKVEVWANVEGQKVNSNQPYDWHCRLSVPGGGLSQRAGEFDFEAPSDGYINSDEISMPVSAGAIWRSKATREYFLHLGDDRYARVQIQVIAGGDHFFAIDSFLNPNSGDHNLEFDPAKEVSPQ